MLSPCARATHDLHISDKEKAQPLYQQTWHRASYHMLTHAIKLMFPLVCGKAKPMHNRSV